MVARSRTGWVFNGLISALTDELGANGHYAMLLDLDKTGDGRRRLDAAMLRRRVDGVITLNLSLDSGELALVDRLNLPLVTVGTNAPGRPAVRINDAIATRTATEHLIGLGHCRIAFLGSIPDPDTGTPQGLLRLSAFVATMRDQGLSPQRSHVVLDGGLTAASAAQAIRRILRRDDRPTAMVAASDEPAFGVVESARRLGLNVPGDLSVIGMDDHALSEVMGLSTIRQDLSRQGRLAAAMLLDCLGDESAATDSVIVPTELVVRGTTAVPDRRWQRRAAPLAAH